MKKLARLKLHALMELSSQLLEDVVDVLVDEDVDVEEVEGVVDEVEMEEEMAMVTKMEMTMKKKEIMTQVMTNDIVLTLAKSVDQVQNMNWIITIRYVTMQM